VENALCPSYADDIRCPADLLCEHTDKAETECLRVRILSISGCTGTNGFRRSFRECDGN